jgi:hypothetical protein
MIDGGQEVRKTDLDVKGAVAIAKQYVEDLFANEGIINLGLEEVQHDDLQGVWLVTLGFSRNWGGGAMQDLLGGRRRDYKVVSLTDAGQVTSLKNRESADAR